ncbi:MAG: hypothetical protein WBE61_00205 [Nitrososphaeraceae archaeon]
MISKISRILVEITIFLKRYVVKCRNMMQDSTFPQTIECGIVTYTTVNSRGRIEYKTSEVVDEEKITSSLSILYDNIRWQEKR